jgi:hypothetical protein
VHLAGGDLDVSGGAADGVGRVGNEIHDHLADLRRIAVEGGEIALQPHDQPRGLRHRGAEQRGELLDQLGQVGAMHQEPTPARIIEHLPGQLGGALGCCLDLCQMVVR